MSLDLETWFWLWLGWGLLCQFLVTKERRDLMLAIGLINANVIMVGMHLLKHLSK